MKKLIVSSVIATTTAMGVAAPVMADLTANVGYASEYYYRGIMQAESSASAGIDFEQSGFYAGAWTADVGAGLEIDLYGGYGIETDSGLNISVGFTTYQYTGDEQFDTEYNELNLNLSFDIFGLEVSAGEHDVTGGSDEDYTFVAFSAEKEGFYGTVGVFLQDWDGSYIEAGYGTEIGGFDAGVALIFSQGDLGPENANWVDGGDDDEAIVFTLGKSFDL